MNRDLPSKLAMPGALGQVARPALVAALDQRLDAAPLVWLVGLPGAGKTGAAAQWVQAAQQRGECCLWYRQDEDDADPAGLLDALRHHPLLGAADRLAGLVARAPGRAAPLCTAVFCPAGGRRASAHGPPGAPNAGV